MADDIYREHKLADAVPRPEPAGPHAGGKPEATHATVAEQEREKQEGQQAHNAQGDVKDRLVDIGKANHTAGRGNGRVSDS